MELDHIFLFVSNEAEARQLMDEAGLRVNYSRAHPGQGTRNLCACLDDVFFELLWLDGSPVSAETERIGLAARGRGNGSPIGVSWRGPTTLETVPYAAPFLPNGRVIHMAVASLNTNVPFVFQSPGGIPPINRSDGLPGDRQRPALATLGFCLLQMQNPGSAANLLKDFSTLGLAEGPPGLRATLLDVDGRDARRITWNAM